MPHANTINIEENLTFFSYKLERHFSLMAFWDGHKTGNRRVKKEGEAAHKHTYLKAGP
jgi:hypothetical protein